MDGGLATLLAFALLALAAGPLLGLMALLRMAALRRRVAALERELSRVPAGGGVPAVRVAPIPATPPVPATPVPTAAAVAAPATATSPASDVATNLGPKIMAGAAALFVVTALAFFVRYAWENNWVGPAGRVLLGAAFSLALLTMGIGALRRRYRPLGQALIAAGLAGLYVVAFAAHGVYGLVPRPAAFGLMVAVTAAAVVLSTRLEARLLAALAWAGAYLAPILLSTGEDRAEALFAYLGLLAVGALALDRRRPWPEMLALAFGGTWLLYGGWFVSHFAARRFAIAAVALVAVTALFALSLRRHRGGLTAAALIMGGLWSLRFEGQSALGVGLTLLALGAIAALASARLWAALAIGLVGAWLVVAAWPGGTVQPHEVGAGVVLATAVFLFYVAMLLRAGRAREGSRPPTWGLHVVNGVAYWLVLFLLLYPGHAWSFTVGTVALAALYLALGTRHAGTPDARALFGLAAAYVAAAIPIQLGLNAITIAWALEGLLLIWLGLRYRSLLARAGGYLVLALAAARLALRHLPIHETLDFRPVLNAGFGTWVFVALALLLAFRLLGDQPRGNERRSIRPLLASASVAILFVGATAETGAIFGSLQRVAVAAQDFDAARRAELLGKLAISLLWSAFASALLVAGLSLRSRALFYAAYGLFAVAAAKVVVVDLATLQTIYRIVSFLALGVLLMAGAFLILRFRHRLAAPQAAGEET